MSPYREPAETLTDERFDIDIGKLDISVSYAISHVSVGYEISTVRFQKFGSYVFIVAGNNKVEARIYKRDIDTILSGYNKKGFVTFIENGRTMAIPMHLVIEITFKNSEYIIKIDPKTNKEYIDAAMKERQLYE